MANQYDNRILFILSNESEFSRADSVRVSTRIGSVREPRE